MQAQYKPSDTPEQVGQATRLTRNVCMAMRRSILATVRRSSTMVYSGKDDTKRSAKFASRAWAIGRVGMLPVIEHDSVPGAMTLFYLHIGCPCVSILDENIDAAKRLHARLRQHWGERVLLDALPTGRHIQDLDRMGIPTAEQLTACARLDCVMCLSDASLSQRRRFPGSLIPRTLTDLGLYAEGTKWSDVQEPQTEIWKGIAHILNRTLGFVTVKQGQYPTLYGVLL